MPPDVLREEQHPLRVTERCRMNTPRSVVHHGAVEHLLHERKDLLWGQTQVLWQRGVVGDTEGKRQAHTAAGGKDPSGRFDYRRRQHYVYYAGLDIDVQLT